jgi:hypothetical protein
MYSKNPKYIVTVGDCNSDDLAEKMFPEAELISLRRADGGAEAYKKFDELIEKGEDVLFITGTTPLHMSPQAETVTKKYGIAAYLGHLNYTLMTKDPEIKYGTRFEGKSVGGISPLAGKIAASLIGAKEYVKFIEPEDSEAAALEMDVDIVSKPTRDDVLDGAGEMHLCCDLTKEFGIRLQYYILTPNKEDHEEEALTIFNKERDFLQQFKHLALA